MNASHYEGSTTMPLLDSVIDLQSATAQQQAQDYLQKVKDSSTRNVGGDMGKNDFLMLLSAQLRYQDPLEPQQDSDFAAQLAQFSSLEQMQNMNTSMDTMNGYQAYGLVGKYVVAEIYMDGSYGQLPGVVDSVFIKDGIMHAQIGEYVVPVSSIKEVFDTNNILTTEMFMQTANQLIGKTVVADMGSEGEIEGIVTRILVDKGKLLAQIDDGTDEPKIVPVNSVVDIRETGTARYTPKPETPPDAMNFRPDPDSDGFIEYDEDMVTPIGRWDWDEEEWEWVYTDFADELEEAA